MFPDGSVTPEVAGSSPVAPVVCERATTIGRFAFSGQTLRGIRLVMVSCRRPAHRSQIERLPARRARRVAGCSRRARQHRGEGSRARERSGWAPDSCRFSLLAIVNFEVQSKYRPFTNYFKPFLNVSIIIFKSSFLLSYLRQPVLIVTVCVSLMQSVLPACFLLF